MNPQVEDGYTRIANELLDGLISYRISGEEMQAFLFIVRKTYGYKKKSDFISLSQFVEATGMKKPTVARAIKKLINKNIVIKNDNELSVNKDKNQWKPLSKKIISVIKNDNAVIKNDNASLSKMITTKDNTTKENITKEIITNVITEFGNSDINEVSQYFLEKMNLPKEDLPSTKSRRYWYTLLRESGRGKDGVKLLIDLASQDSFYRNNISSSMDLYYKRVKLVARKRGDMPKIAVMPKRQEGSEYVGSYSRN